MNKTKYNQLRKAIISAVPEIVELKRNCVIERLETNYLYKITEILGNGNTFLRGVVTPKVLNQNLFKNALKILPKDEIIIDYKIIGRSITLEDCLIAIGETNYIFSTSDDGFLWAMDARTLEKGKCFWRMNTPLQDQSEECKELLWDLICNEKKC